jgi:hypothetical protein
MHRSLKDAVCKPPRANLRAQQRAFDEFVPEYNDERPNEAIDMQTPSLVHEQSRRLYPHKLLPVEYASWVSVRQVRSNGCIKWRGGFIYISQVLAGEPVGLRQLDERTWEVSYSFYPLGILDEKIGKVLPMSPV